MKHLKLFELYEKPNLVENHIYDHLKLLKKYISIVNNENVDIIKNYFIIVYNFLILEIGFDKYLPDYTPGYGDLRINNKLLCLRDANSYRDVCKEFLKIYEPVTLTRNAVEKFTENEIIKEYIKDKPYIFNTLLDIEETLDDIKYFLIYSKYNL